MVSCARTHIWRAYGEHGSVPADALIADGEVDIGKRGVVEERRHVCGVAGQCCGVGRRESERRNGFDAADGIAVGNQQIA